MTKKQLEDEITSKIGKIKKIISLQNEVDGINWYKAIYFKIDGKSGNQQSVNYYVLNEGKISETAYYQTGSEPKEVPVPLTKEELFEQQVQEKLNQLKVEEEAQARLLTDK